MGRDRAEHDMRIESFVKDLESNHRSAESSVLNEARISHDAVTLESRKNSLQLRILLLERDIADDESTLAQATNPNPSNLCARGLMRTEPSSRPTETTFRTFSFRSGV